MTETMCYKIVGGDGSSGLKYHQRNWCSLQQKPNNSNKSVLRRPWQNGGKLGGMIHVLVEVGKNIKDVVGLDLNTCFSIFFTCVVSFQAVDSLVDDPRLLARWR